MRGGKKMSASLITGLGITVLACLIALLAPILSLHDPYESNPANILAAPSTAHWLGTDQLGRDVLARILYGARTSLGIAVSVAIISVGLGVALGGASALAGGWIDNLVMRTVDVLLSIPSLVIALALAAVMGPSLINLVLILGFLGAPFMTRLFRGQALSLVNQNFVLASRLLGAGFSFRLFRHVLPNMAPFFATLVSQSMSSALLVASALSFIGLGAQPPTAEWGALVYEGRNNIMHEWWCAIPAGMAIALSAAGFILLGDGLRDWLDPRSETR